MKFIFISIDSTCIISFSINQLFNKISPFSLDHQAKLSLDYVVIILGHVWMVTLKVVLDYFFVQKDNLMFGLFYLNRTSSLAQSLVHNQPNGKR